MVRYVVIATQHCRECASSTERYLQLPSPFGRVAGGEGIFGKGAGGGRVSSAERLGSGEDPLESVLYLV